MRWKYRHHSYRWTSKIKLDQKDGWIPTVKNIFMDGYFVKLSRKINGTDLMKLNVASTLE